MLLDLAEVLGERRINDARARLRKPSRAAVATEWEIAILAGLRGQGSLTVMPCEHGVADIDVIFSPRSVDAPTVVEVTVVSDHGFKNENPVEHFTSEVSGHLWRRGVLSSGALKFQIGHRDAAKRVILGVPLKRDVEAFLESSEFRRFCSDIQQDPQGAHALRFHSRDIESEVAYTPGAKYTSIRYRSFHEIRDPERNPIVARLEDKDDQIGRSKVKLPAVVVLCDGGCNALSTTMTSTLNATIEAVVDRYLNGLEHQQAGPWLIENGVRSRARHINAVVLVSVHEGTSPIRTPSKRFAKARIVWNRGTVRYPLDARVAEHIAAIVPSFPPIRMMPINAARRSKRPPFYGASTISLGLGHMNIKISLQAFLQLLSGELSSDHFRRDHPDVVRVIQQARADGRAISAVRVEHCVDDDDDWLTVELEATDPARVFDVKKPGDAVRS